MTEKEFFNRYNFNVREDKVGGGSFGTVYKAYDTVLDREVAVKVSEVRISGDKEFSLREEFKAIEKLPPHANIANYEEVHTFESFNGVFDYAIMQYYPLGNLDSFLSKKSLSFEEKEKLVLAILDGIAHLHKHKIVQRDLKPSNILVVDRRGQLIPKITDFGLSKQANADSKASRFTNSFAGGTLQYCSPEQIKGQPLKLNTDLWSFGAIAYEIFTGKALFQVEGSTSASAEWQNEVSKKILHEDYSAKLKELTGNWPAVVAACLERDMNERVKDAEELLKILKGDSIIEDTSATQILPQADNDATQIFSNEPKLESEEEAKPEKPEPAKIQKETGPKESEEKKAEQKTTIPKPKKSNKKVWIGVAAGLIAAMAVTYGFTFMDNSEPVEESSKKIAETPVLFKKDSLFGYKIEDQVVIEPAYVMADNFSNGRAKVQTQDSVFYINEEGNWMASFTENSEEEALADNSEKEDEKNKEENSINEKDKTSGKLSLAEQKQIYEEGESFYEANQYKEAYEKFIQIANLGHAEAEFMIGKMYDNGYYLKESDSNAIDWYLKAGKHRNNKGYGNIGFIYYVKKDYGRAMEWFLKAANEGNGVSMNNIGVMYIEGQGVDKNVEKAVDWYLKAVEKGHAIAMNNLGKLYRNGKHVFRDYKKAMDYFKMAANKGNGESMNTIGVMYENGEGVNMDYGKAAEWFERAYNNGDEWGAYNLGQLYYEGKGFAKNKSKAFEWFLKAADKGHTDAMCYIGNIYGNTEEKGYNWEKAREWYEKAANKGNRWGKRELGEFYLFGVGGVSQDQNKAKRLFREAANAGDDKAKTYLQVISDIENNKYYQLNESNKGNKLYVNDGDRNVDSMPLVFSDYTHSWAVNIQYEMGNSTTGVQIWPLKVESDGVSYAQYWPCNVLQEKQGMHRTGIAWAGHNEKYNDGGRQIGYMYVYGKFYGSEEELKIKMPVMLCWKPRHYYQ
ncbi:protein kinase [Gramella sp. KN1008]|uniref:protein kinase domain-containing protein n=1 Tax=Gramella sp. KN1008 TaxID=2529298 RepID=UPI00103FB9DD|nr:protein kinase [Gramella sp. KN1008]TBW28253.1 hypothetical protein EZJ28_05770 [Gramella sp. KN1008]